MPEVYKLEAAISKVNSVRSNGNYTQERLNKIDDDVSNKISLSILLHVNIDTPLGECLLCAFQ